MIHSCSVRAPLPLQRAGTVWRRTALLPFTYASAAILPASILADLLLGTAPWLLTCSVLLLAISIACDRQWRPSAQELCQQLNARYPVLEDSADLLLGSQTPGENPLVALQRDRIIEELATLQAHSGLKDFRPDWRRAPVFCAIVFPVLVIAAGTARHLPPALHPNGGQAKVTATQQPIAAAQLALENVQVTITPPGYTGLASATVPELDLHVPEGTEARWDLLLSAPVERLLMGSTGKYRAFLPIGDLPARRWQLTRRIDESEAYLLQAVPQQASDTNIEAVTLDDIHNLEVIPDNAPDFEFSFPRDPVTVLPDAESRDAGMIDVTVNDDYGFATHKGQPRVELSMTLASGTGENVRFRSKRYPMTPDESEKNKLRYRFRLPLAKHSIEPGDEVYWQLIATDNRQPQANIGKSASFIVRWPQEEVFGLSDAEGMAIRVMPEYFRSQRQLIIDTEALLAEAAQLTPEKFRARSESLAYEQNLLRMRYGRFLGEEDSGLEKHDEAKPGTAGKSTSKEKKGHEEHDHSNPKAKTHSHAHEPDQGAAKQQFGDATGVVESAGHSHDTAEHATLFDPQTKELLRSALNAMWTSWRELSIIEPRASLPHQYEALRYIKEVQQASRIYLQRVGFETPPLDEQRRLTGETEEAVAQPVKGARQEPGRTLVLSMLELTRHGAPLPETSLAKLRALSLFSNGDTPVAFSRALLGYQQQPASPIAQQTLRAVLMRLLPPPQPSPTLPQQQQGKGPFGQWLRQQYGTTDKLRGGVPQ